MFFKRDDIKNNEMLDEYLILLDHVYKKGNIHQDTYSEDLVKRFYRWLERREQYLKENK